MLWWDQRHTIVVMIGLILLVSAVFLYPVFAVSRDSGRHSSLSNAKQIGTSTAIYLADHDDHFPVNFSTHLEMSDSLYDYTRSFELFEVPTGGVFLPNPKIAGLDIKDLTDLDSTVLVYAEKKGPEGYAVAFLDTHAKMVDDLSTLNFDPVFKGD